MLTVDLPDVELYDEVKNEFIVKKGRRLVLEHSLVSLSKWESKWNKPFLTNDDKTPEELLDYIKCMTITQNVSDETYEYLTRKTIREINDYIHAPMTATTINSVDINRRGPNRSIVTSEIIYYWMIALNIPMECQKWHLNRLLTLIQVCNIKNKPPKKMGRRALLNRNKALNAARRKRLKSRG